MTLSKRLRWQGLRILAILMVGHGILLHEGSAVPDATCMECHIDPELEMERDGMDVLLFVEPQMIAESVHDLWSCVDCHEGYDPDSIPHAEQPVRVNCMLCHDDAEELAEAHPFHPNFALETPDFSSPDLACVGCHGSHAIVPVDDERFAFHGRAMVESCAQCHEAEAGEFVESAHMTASGSAPDCLSCHRTDVVNGGIPMLELKQVQSRQCIDCHVDLETDGGHLHLDGQTWISQWIESVHGSALEAGNADAASCVDCHGSHRMKAAMNQDSDVNKLHIVDTCQQCHGEVAEAFSQSVHAKALLVGNTDSPACTDCHGEHLILHADDPISPVAPRNVSQQLCGDCHGSVRLSRKYGISSDRFDTFADSYHGLSMRGGAVEVVNCASCHGYHTILPSSDPASMVHKSNLAATCGSCHPKASELYAMGKVHVSLKPVRPSEIGTGRESIPQWVATLYVFLIVGVVGGMVLHNLLDFLRKVHRKVQGHRHGIKATEVPHRLYLRMTVNERVQHAVLASSFVVLVITGFMLRYPEAWWVEGLRKLNSHVFEWRSWTHRIAGIILLAAGAWHVLYLMLTRRGRELFHALLPRLRDLTDMIGVVRYNLGLSAQKPEFTRFSYIEKTEYWAMIWGSVLMGITGVLLWADQMTINLVGKVGFDVAHVIHFYEAILATLAIVVWHFYFVIFNPDVYPMNLSWLTGYLSEEEMLEEHPAWLAELKDGAEPSSGETPPSEAPETAKEDRGTGKTP